MTDKLKCDNHRCGWVGTEPLTAEDPFNPGEELQACPKCKDQNLVAACFATGCHNEATSGNKWPDGVYRWSCHDHNPKIGRIRG